MPRRRLYDKKISENSRRVKLSEEVEEHIKKTNTIIGRKPIQIIRDLCDAGLLQELTTAQFSLGTTKIFQSVMTKLMRSIIGEPLEQNTAAIQLLKK